MSEDGKLPFAELNNRGLLGNAVAPTPMAQWS
jgi:hypothetical protein